MVQQQSAWIVRTKEQPQQRLFCFPYAGGGASIYRKWARNSPPAIEVCPVQLPARENRLLEPSYTQILQLVPELARELEPYSDQPFAFFGHSMGALIAFELAHYLRRHGLPEPEQLFFSAHRAPHLPRRSSNLHLMPDQE